MFLRSKHSVPVPEITCKITGVMTPGILREFIYLLPWVELGVKKRRYFIYIVRDP